MAEIENNVSAYEWIRSRAHNDYSLKRAINEAVALGMLADSEAYVYYKDISRELKDQGPVFTLD